jgi:hypothetical protein
MLIKIGRAIFVFAISSATFSCLVSDAQGGPTITVEFIQS